MTFLRTFDLERGVIDPETGRFPAVVFTDGEASDGHILNIAGARTAARMPLFVNHDADPSTQLGSLVNPRKTDHEIRYEGEIEMTGSGPLADIRRDIALMMQRGHVYRMSGRWDARQEDAVLRTSLDKDHPAYVSDRATGAKRYGLYFARWDTLEGSLVGLGADAKAIAGRAQEQGCPDAAREFWRSFAAEQAASPDGETGSLVVALSRLRIASEEAKAAGATLRDRVNAVGTDLEPDDLEAFEFDGHTLLLPKSLCERLRAPAPAPEPAAPAPEEARTQEPVIGFSLEDLQRLLVVEATKFKNELREEANALLYRELGVVVK